MTPEIDLAIKLLLLGLAVLGAGVGLGKWLFKGGETKHEITSSITTLGIELRGLITGVSSRLDRHERAREEEAKERAVAAAAEQQRRLEEAVHRAQVAERERSLVAAVNGLRENVDKLNDTSSEHHVRIRDLEKKSGERPAVR